MSEINNMHDSDSFKHNDCDCHFHKRSVLTKIPVVLAEVDLQIPIDAIIKFPEPVLEIKDIKKHVKLTQCRLLLPTNKLFVKGFVRKNIQYASPCKDVSNYMKKAISSDLLSLTVDIPFQHVSEIKYFLSQPDLPEINVRNEFDFLISKPLPCGFPHKDELQTKDLSQFHQESTQFYNELPFCELVSSHIVEWDEAINRRHLPYHLGEGTFTKIEEKMVLDLTIKILQKQQVHVSHANTHNEHDNGY